MVVWGGGGRRGHGGPVPGEGVAAVSFGLDEFVADAPECLDLHGRICQFRAEMLYVDIDGAGFAGEVVAPDRAEELVAGEGDAGVFDEGDEEVEFFGAEVDELAIDAGFAAGFVDGEIAEGDGVLGFSAAFDAVEDAFDAGDEFAGVEGFGHVVVGAEFEADDLVDVVAACGEHDDGDVAFAAKFAEDLEAIEAGHHDVEDDEGGRGLLEAGDGFAAVGGVFDGIAFFFEVEGVEVADVGFVVDEEDFLGHGRLWAGGLGRSMRRGP